MKSTTLKLISTIFIYTICIFSIAYADDCPDPGEDPFTPDNIEDTIQYALNTQICCCYDNNISVIDYTELLYQEGYCCEEEDQYCNTYWITIVRQATPVVRDNLINETEGGEAVYDEVPEWTLDLYCLCSGGAGSTGPCHETTMADYNGDGDPYLYDFECEGCLF